MALQYPLPFLPSPAWWVARDAELTRDWLIDRALWVASLAMLRPWEPPTSAEDVAPGAPVQLEFAFPAPARPTILGRLLDESDAVRDADTPSADLATAVAGMPPSPEYAWAQIDHIVDGLRDRGVEGHDALIRTIALLTSPSYRAQGFGPRLLLAAPPSAGKTFLLGALAETLGLPSLHIDAGVITPEGWSGTNVSDLLDHKIGVGPGRFTLEQWRDGAVLVLDEIDKACRANADDRHGTQVRLERQHAMLGLVWGGLPIRLANGDEIKTDRWIVAACGAFASSRFVAEQRPPTDAELIAWGMSPELASRLPIRLTITPQPIPALIERLRADPRGLRHATQLAASLGYTLEVPTATLARLAVLMHESPATFTTRTASAAIVQAVIQQLAEAGIARVGERLVIAPDDLPLTHRGHGRRIRPDDDTSAASLA